MLAATLIIGAGASKRSRRRLARSRRRHGRDPGVPAHTGVAVAPPGQWTLIAGAVLAIALSASVQVHLRESTGLRALATEQVTVRLIGVVRSSTVPVGDPAAGLSRTSIVVEAFTRDLASFPESGSWISAAATVLLFVQDLDLAYGTRIDAGVRLSPAQDRGDRAVAVGRPVGSIQIRAGPAGALGVTRDLRASLSGLAAELPGDAGALLPAITVGDTSAVGDLDQLMRTSGLAHITAVSGAHFSMVAAVVIVLAGWLRVPRRWRWLPTLAVTTAFVLLVEPGPTVVRAALMGLVTMIGVTVGRPSRALPALFAAVIALLVVDPWLCADLGFVLSVAATAGIALLTGPLAGRFEDRIGRPAALALAVPMAAQAACGPVILLLTPAVPVYAVPANLVAAPAVAPATVLGLLATVLTPFWPALAGWCAALAGAACWWIGATARIAVALPGAQLGWIQGPAGVLALAVASGAALALVLWRRRDVAP